MEISIEVLQLTGSYCQIGMKQGRRWVRDDTFSLVQDMTRSCDTMKAKAALKKTAPFLLEELKGAADGLKVDQDTIVRMYSGYDVAFPSMGCTVFANNDFYVRNYDFSPELYDARFVFCRPDNGYSSAGFSEQMAGRLDGINEKGLVAGLHLVNEQRPQSGFLGTSIVRMILDQCATVSEAISLLQDVPHGYCYNYSLMDQSGEAVVVEASPERQVVRSGRTMMCTNHFEMDAQKENNRKSTEFSRKRLEKLRAAVSDQKLSPTDAYHLFNKTDSPFFFPYCQEYFGTMHTIVYDPVHLRMIIGIGGDCEPYVLSLQDWLDDEAVLPGWMKGLIDANR